MDEWERMVPDHGTTNGRQSVFRQNMHQYWVMKNIVARAMTLHREHMAGEEVKEQEDEKEKDPI